AAGAEVVGGDDLADESEDPGDARCERENRRLPGQPAARVSPVHVASIGTPSAVSVRRAPRAARSWVQPPPQGGAPSHLPLRSSLPLRSAPVCDRSAPKT